MLSPLFHTCFLVLKGGNYKPICQFIIRWNVLTPGKSVTIDLLQIQRNKWLKMENETRLPLIQVTSADYQRKEYICVKDWFCSTANTKERERLVLDEKLWEEMIEMDTICQSVPVLRLLKMTQWDYQCDWKNFISSTCSWVKFLRLRVYFCHNWEKIFLLPYHTDRGQGHFHNSIPAIAECYSSKLTSGQYGLPEQAWQFPRFLFCRLHVSFWFRFRFNILWINV